MFVFTPFHFKNSPVCKRQYLDALQVSKHLENVSSNNVVVKEQAADHLKTMNNTNAIYITS